MAYSPQVKRLFDNVFSTTNNSVCNKNGYIMIDDKTTIPVTILKESSYGGYCNYCCDTPKEPPPSFDHEILLKRLTCRRTEVYHYVVYEKFDTSLSAFVGTNRPKDQPQNNHADFNETSVMSIMKHIIEAVQTFHNNDIFHLNINPDVIVVFKSETGIYKVKFLDFFMSRNADYTSPVVPYRRTDTEYDYMAPELIRYQMMSQRSSTGLDADDTIIIDKASVDVFSVGLCLLFTCAKYNAFERDYTATVDNILSEDFCIDYPNIRIWNVVGNDYYLHVENLLKRLIKFDPRKRAVLSVALQSPLFK